HSHMRIVDYRLGQYKLKCKIFDQLALTKKLRKVYTLVEKQDSNSWRTVGFSKEAVLPGYFKNADGYLMSRVYDQKGDPITGGLSKVNPKEGIEFPEPSPPRKKPNGLKYKMIFDTEKISKIMKHKDIHHIYNPYGQDMYHPKLILEARIRNRRLWVGGEINTAFGHIKLDILTAPKNKKEHKYLTWMLYILMQELQQNYDMLSVFSFSDIRDKSVGQVLNDACLEQCGQLTCHLKDKKGDVTDAYVWHRKLQPNEVKP
ncbi:MAG: hypothetical protein PF689_03985, partial [Deltaproteobacteria bacterium]|nr:hypothetical protein [Deltaproteobacteria bacterium]